MSKNTYLGAKTHWSLQKRGVNDSVVLQDLPTTTDLRSRLILRVVRILNLLTDWLSNQEKHVWCPTTQNFVPIINALFLFRPNWRSRWHTLPETNIAPKNGWLEYYFPIGEFQKTGDMTPPPTCHLHLRKLNMNQQFKHILSESLWESKLMKPYFVGGWHWRGPPSIPMTSSSRKSCCPKLSFEWGWTTTIWQRFY